MLHTVAWDRRLLLALRGDQEWSWSPTAVETLKCVLPVVWLPFTPHSPAQSTHCFQLLCVVALMGLILFF